MKLCAYCKEEIHPLRLEILPHTKTCIRCSKEGPKAGRIVIHGTGEEIHTELQIIDNETHIRLVEEIEKYQDSSLEHVEEEDDFQEED